MTHDEVTVFIVGALLVRHYFSNFRRSLFNTGYDTRVIGFSYVITTKVSVIAVSLPFMLSA